jgi:hypothetical protein
LPLNGAFKTIVDALGTADAKRISFSNDKADPGWSPWAVVVSNAAGEEIRRTVEAELMRGVPPRAA